MLFYSKDLGAFRKRISYKMSDENDSIDIYENISSSFYEKFLLLSIRTIR